MALGDIHWYSAFLVVQLVGMVGFYIYYTYRNKQAEKAYWQKVNQG